MAYYPVDLRQFSYRSPDGRHRGVFRPNGPIRHTGRRRNSLEERINNTHSARIFLGFNAGAKPKWTMKDVTEWTKKRRMAQIAGKSRGKEKHAAPDASFIYQKGIWTHTKPGPDGGMVVTENSMQIVFLNVGPAEKAGTFKHTILDLAQDMVRHFEQDAVFVDFQLNGISRMTAMATP